MTTVKKSLVQDVLGPSVEHQMPRRLTEPQMKPPLQVRKARGRQLRKWDSLMLAKKMLHASRPPISCLSISGRRVLGGGRSSWQVGRVNKTIAMLSMVPFLSHSTSSNAILRTSMSTKEEFSSRRECKRNGMMSTSSPVKEPCPHARDALALKVSRAQSSAK